MADISLPETTNPLATFVDELIKAAISGGDVAVEAYLTAQAPFLALPVFEVILNYIITSVGTAVYKNMANIANDIVFDIQTNSENSTVLQAAIAAQAAKASGDQSAIDKANQDLINSLGNLIHSDGSATP